MAKDGFLQELRRRNVLRAGAVYAASAWLLVQVAAEVFPFFHVAEWVVRWIVVAAIIGLPFWLAFAWFYEFTPQGLKLESQVDPAESIARRMGKKLDRWIIAILALAVVLLLTNQLVLHKDASVGANAVLSPAPAKSIAGLPLINESGDPHDQYFSDGLSEELIAALTQIHDLKVIGRNSSFQFRDDHQADNSGIGRKLGVATLLEGTARKQGDRVRIVVGLILASDGNSLWSQIFDRELKDIFAVQSDIAQSVAGALKVTLLGKAAESSDKPPGGNISAYNAYLQGKFYDARVNVDGYRKAIDFYSEAIRLDPQYAMAYARESLTWTNLAAEQLSGAEAQQAYGKARAAADNALSLNPNLALAHAARGWLLSYTTFDQTVPEAEFRHALELAPNDSEIKNDLASELAVLGQLEEAVTLTQQALATDPLHAGWYGNLAADLSALGRLDEAEHAIRKAIELEPAEAFHHRQLAIIEIQRGNSEAALRAAALEPDSIWKTNALALAYAAHCDHAKSDAALQTLIDQHAGESAFQIAQIYAARKEPDRMFAWLERAWDQRDPGITGLLYDPFLLAYKRDPRFVAFCKKVGLPVAAKR